MSVSVQILISRNPWYYTQINHIIRILCLGCAKFRWGAVYIVFVFHAINGKSNVFRYLSDYLWLHMLSLFFEGTAKNMPFSTICEISIVDRP